MNEQINNLITHCDQREMVQTSAVVNVNITVVTGVSHRCSGLSWLAGECLQAVRDNDYFFLYSLGFSMFSPRGARLRNKWIKFYFTLFLMVAACRLLGGNSMIQWGCRMRTRGTLTCSILDYILTTFKIFWFYIIIFFMQLQTLWNLDSFL